MEEGTCAVLARPITRAHFASWRLAMLVQACLSVLLATVPLRCQADSVVFQTAAMEYRQLATILSAGDRAITALSRKTQPNANPVPKINAHTRAAACQVTPQTLCAIATPPKAGVGCTAASLIRVRSFSHAATVVCATAKCLTCVATGAAALLALPEMIAK
jgi:hypothetical protein